MSVFLPHTDVLWVLMLMSLATIRLALTPRKVSSVSTPGTTINAALARSALF